MSLPAWIRRLVFGALGKVVVGVCLAVVVLLRLEGDAGRIPIFLAFVLTNAIAGVLLLAGKGRRPADLLGVILLFSATPYADAVVRAAVARSALADEWLVLHYLQFDAFTPYFLWLFAGVFPASTPLGRPRQLHRRFTSAALAIAISLFAANLLMFLGHWLPLFSEEGPLGLIRRRSVGSYYWAIIFTLDAGALAFCFWKATRSAMAERQRAIVFVAALIFGYAPLMVLTILQPFSTAVASLFTEPVSKFWTLLVFDVTKGSLPFTTSYAVLVRRVVDYELILRQALRYSMSRYGALAFASAPLVSMAAFLYLRREQSLGSLASGAAAWILLALTILSLALLRHRERWQRALDRRFFRERYDAQAILGSLIEKVRAALEPEAIGLLIEQEVDRALHCTTTRFFVRDREEGTCLVPLSGGCRPLDLDSDLAQHLAQRGIPLEIDLSAPSAEVFPIAMDTEDWLADGGFRLLTPVLSSDGELLGLVALGEKASEIPFTREDLSLLSTLASTAAIAIEKELLRSSSQNLATIPRGLQTKSVRPPTPGKQSRPPSSDSPRAAPLVPAFECLSCASLQEGKESGCNCGGSLRPLGLPLLLLGKFRLLRRLGTGGMGVVYLAEDLTLGRRVAVKTLPRMAPQQSARLRREARAIAAVEHPNLATIYGVEAWHRLPLLVLEYLAGGTLSTRLRDRGRLEIADALEVGARIVNVVTAIHAAGILHRDIKPSNIGFSAAGVPKLLDFGLAKLLLSEDGHGSEVAVPIESRGTDQTSVAVTKEGRVVVGTPLYLSPEALRGEDPDYAFDLWSLSVSLYESIAGRHPFRAGNTQQTIARILAGACPRLSDLTPGYCPPELDAFFALALSPRRSQRPTTADELGQRLAEVERVAA